MDEILKTFNEMLHSGKHTRKECYDWLMAQRALHPEIPDFAFLYPEELNVDNLLKDIPTWTLQNMLNSIYGDIKGINTPAYKEIYNKIVEELKRRSL